MQLMRKVKKKDVQKRQLTASEIEVRLGATWIPVEIYQQFLYELLDTPSWVRNYTKLSYSSYNANWNISAKNMDKESVKADKTYGTSRANAYRLMEDCLNLKQTKIFDYEYDAVSYTHLDVYKRQTQMGQLQYTRKIKSERITNKRDLPRNNR